MANTNKNILLVTSEFPPLPGGIGNHAYNLANHLKLNGLNISVLTDQRSITNEEINFDSKLDFKVYRVKIKRLRAIMYLKRLFLLFKLLKKSDTIIASGKFSLWIVALSSFFYRRKFIAVIHGSEVNYTNLILKRTINISLKKFNKVIAVSNFTKNLVSHLKLKKVIVIPNGFDKSKWLNRSDNFIDLVGNPKLLTVGNVTERKGQLNVIKHLPEIVKIYPNIHYHCVGLETESDKFLKEAKRLGVARYISFHGKVTHEKLIDFYDNSDVFIMLSNLTATGDIEGFGIAILEANFFGLPAIGSKNCGIEDAIENYKSGILVNYNNTDDFKNALNEVINQKENFELESKKWASKHRWEIIVNQYINEITT